MFKILVTFFLIFFSVQINSQQIKVDYLYVRSPLATLKETLYIKGNKTFSIQDSVIHIQNTDNEYLSKKNTHFSPQIISELKSGELQRKFTTVENISNNNEFIFSVSDDAAKQDWKIDYKSSKKILNYLCYRAETTFRGRKFVAYFTKDLPFQSGPYKFYGLPGLILELYAANISHYRWKANAIYLDNTDKIDFNSIYKNLNNITLKDFVEISDKKRESFFAKVNSEVKLPTGIKSQTVQERPGIEMIYEWE